VSDHSFVSIVPHFAETLNPSTATMKHLFAKIKRKKSPKPPQQTTPTAKPADVAAGLPNSRAELDVIPDGGRNLSYEGPEADRTDPMVLLDEGGEGSKILAQDETDGVRELHTFGTSTSGVVTGGTGCGNQPESEWFRSPRWARHSRGPVFLFPLAECPGNAGRGETETSKGMPRCIDAVGFHSPCASCGGISRGDITWGHKKVRYSQTRPRGRPCTLC
jgi:hypothetical protein